ncbi:unnamed protein product [Malus baccata var. baccata]
MSFCTFFPEKSHNYPNRERGHNNNMSRLAPFLVTFLATATIFSLFLLYSPNPFLISPKQGLNDLNSVQNQTSIHAAQKEHQAPDRTNIKLLPPPKKEEECDLFEGHWIPDLRGAMYTNSSCATIPESKNCFRNGRRDRDFLNWRWKPDKCELPRFDPKTFLEIVRGKKMAFIGDSVARNHVESLLCLLSQEENPKDIYKYSDDRFRIWYFPQYDFTLMKLWSKYLIAAEERMVNGSGSGVFDLLLDKVDDKWAEQLPELDYAIFSAGHWFFRLMYLHEGDKLTGCVYCNEPNVTEYNNSQALRMAFRAIFKYLNDCKNCKGGLLTLLRTFAPAHFEGGAWNTGGYCNRTSPLSKGEIDLGRFDWELRSIQVEEFERAKKEGEMEGRRFRVLDITRAMLMRPDGHPGVHWGNKWMKGYNDCVHWCMPGPVDYWNHFLMEIIRNEGGLVS